MVFLAGALVGLVVGLAAVALFARRTGRSSLTEGRGFATAVALLALLIAAVALANSDRRHDQPGRVASAAATTSPTTTNAATSSTSAGGGLITVPNVEHIARVQAVPILRHAGLEVSIERLPLSNVPAGFVISQNPLPGATATAGATVTVVVSNAP